MQPEAAPEPQMLLWRLELSQPLLVPARGAKDHVAIEMSSELPTCFCCWLRKVMPSQPVNAGTNTAVTGCAQLGLGGPGNDLQRGLWHFNGMAGAPESSSLPLQFEALLGSTLVQLESFSHARWWKNIQDCSHSWHREAHSQRCAVRLSA